MHSVWYIHGVKLCVDRVIVISFVEPCGKHNGILVSALGVSLAELSAEGRGDSADTWVN